MILGLQKKLHMQLHMQMQPYQADLHEAGQLDNSDTERWPIKT